MASAFSRLAPFVREYIYEKKWKGLRNIQEDVICEIFDGDGHILIAAGTASGKTEAFFFPVISLISEKPPASVGVLYIGPLKALINDQANRLEPLLERAEIPLWRWHGDISGNHKKKLMQNPSGILQITPESLEALLLRSPQMLPDLFKNLSFVIIDEVHAFMGSERGSQILCQLKRITDAAGCKFRRIGLSATLGDYQGALEWLGKGSNLGTKLICEKEGKRHLGIAVDHFVRATTGDRSYYDALYRETRGRRCIIFTNSRIEAEQVITALKEISAQNHNEGRFFIHHGSIDASLRNETERALRESPFPITAAATATLEMGIDIGALDRVMQIGPPTSVSGFVQRLGRSGRLRGNPEIYFSSLEEDEKWEHPVNSIPWELIKTIAIIELYIKEKWIEPGEENPLPYSLLLHQTLSILTSMPGQHPSALTKKILALPAFANISESDFSELLLAIGGTNGEEDFTPGKPALLERTTEGELLVGFEAEKLCSHYSFYSIFPGAADYRVLSNGREIGKINFIPPEGSSIVLGGRYWRVDYIVSGNRGRREILVSKGEAGTSHTWRSGGVELHKQVALYMRKILSDDTEYPYLSKRAKERLGEARILAKQWRLAKEIFIAPVSSNTTAYDASPPDANEPFVLLPWMGSRGQRTLLLILQNRDYRKILGIRSISRENELSINIQSSLAIPRFRQELAEILQNYPDRESLYPLIEPGQIPVMGKFDTYLPAKLLVKQYVASMLDTDELKSLRS